MEYVYLIQSLANPSRRSIGVTGGLERPMVAGDTGGLSARCGVLRKASGLRVPERRTPMGFGIMEPGSEKGTTLSKRRKKTRTKKRTIGKVTELPVRQAASKQVTDKKLSEIIKEMAERLLEKPDAPASAPATVAVLMLAGAAWNSAVGDHAMREQHRKLAEQIEWDDVTPWRAA